jgi:hypothetical protein
MDHRETQPECAIGSYIMWSLLQQNFGPGKTVNGIQPPEKCPQLFRLLYSNRYPRKFRDYIGTLSQEIFDLCPRYTPEEIGLAANPIDQKTEHSLNMAIIHRKQQTKQVRLKLLRNTIKLKQYFNQTMM